LQKSGGFPSVSTVMCRHKIPQLHASIKKPSKDEMGYNISTLLGPDGKPPPDITKFGELPGMQLILDDTALEELC
jgi:hypothetical protein